MGPPETSNRHRILPLKVIPDARGRLCVIEHSTGLPFDIARVYYLFDVPTGSERGGHAHHDLQQLLIAISGTFVVDVVTAEGTHNYRLDRPDEALYVGSYVWREIRNFSSNAVCLVLASAPYNKADYIYDRAEFDRIIRG